MQFKQKMSEKKSTWNSTQKHDVIVSDMGEKKVQFWSGIMKLTQKNTTLYSPWSWADAPNNSFIIFLKWLTLSNPAWVAQSMAIANQC